MHMSAIEWIESEIWNLEDAIGVLKAQRKVLMDAAKGDGIIPPPPVKAAKVTKEGNGGAPRKPRVAGIKEAVVGVIADNVHGMTTAGIIAALPGKVEGSIRQALNGLKKKGIAKQDGKMWVMATPVETVRADFTGWQDEETGETIAA